MTAFGPPLEGSYIPCDTHPGSPVRRYRAFGPVGPAVYPQCIPVDGAAPHLLTWRDPLLGAAQGFDTSSLSPAELQVLDDAAHGLTVYESARKRSTSSETVKSQRRSILLKLEARNMAHAVGLLSGAV